MRRQLLISILLLSSASSDICVLGEEIKTVADRTIEAFPVKLGDGPLLVISRPNRAEKRHGDGEYVFNPITGQDPQLALRSSQYISTEARVGAHQLVLFCDS